VPAAEAYSAGRWLEDAVRAIQEAWAKSLLPIVVGGTGLYFRSLERGLVAIAQVPQEIRARWRSALAKRGSEALHAELAARSPEEAARLRPSDGQRIARALEVLEATGEALGAHQRRQEGRSVLAGAEVVRIPIVPDREVLYQRCDARFLQMMEQGALDEVRRLLALGLDPTLPAMKAIGVEPLARHLRGGIPLDEAIRIAQRDTRNYAKRQLTWLRHQMPGFNRVNDADDAVKRALDLCRGWA
jgi:tRNA dimethylallyltransferase